MEPTILQNSTIYNADCFDILHLIPDKSIDMILCDLPYETTDLGWDCLLDMFELWNEYNRVTKPNAAIVLTASQPFTSKLIISNIENFKYVWIWDKVNRFTGYGNSSFMPLKRHEDICVFVKSGKPTFNKQMEEGKPYIAKRSGKKPEVYGNGGLNPKNGVNTGTRNPADILSIKADRKKEMGKHPTQKPIELFEYLIKTYTNEGDTVLDNTMGSGTTGVACVNTGRKFIGIEKEKNYFDIAVKRIKEARHKLFV
jgi:site-specific DNA-methyltransferase (adenine-specific)